MTDPLPKDVAHMNAQLCTAPTASFRKAAIKRWICNRAQAKCMLEKATCVCVWIAECCTRCLQADWQELLGGSRWHCDHWTWMAPHPASSTLALAAFWERAIYVSYFLPSFYRCSVWTSTLTAKFLLFKNCFFIFSYCAYSKWMLFSWGGWKSNGFIFCLKAKCFIGMCVYVSLFLLFRWIILKISF